MLCKFGVELRSSELAELELATDEALGRVEPDADDNERMGTER